ncbi:anti-phage ZorAB system protein ZorA [Microbacterium sp. gxy059]|uniref:anti-phage ZorAB system protein ZorA n=1 Tax=Microbacterium sp. gxy059 TaxID=2957199 RepID=UPI003D98CBE3
MDNLIGILRVLFPFPPTSWSDGLTLAFIVVIIAVMCWSFVALRRYRRDAEARIAAVGRLADSLGNGGSAAPAPPTDEASEAEKTAGKLWGEFCETLVRGDDGRLRNTVEADFFFNERSLAGGLSQNRLLVAAPGLLTALGVLGTFLGLVLGLSGLRVGDENDLLTGIEHLIESAAIAFATSVWGVLTSILVNVAEKSDERKVLAKIQELQADIDGALLRITPESALVDIRRSAHEADQSLRQLDERIGDRLQVGLDQVTSRIESSLHGAITDSLGPAIEKLVERTTQQSETVFEVLVNRFAESFSRLGEQQAKALSQAAAELSIAVSAVTQTLEEVRVAHRETADQLRDLTEETARHLAGGAEAAKESHERLDAAAEKVREVLNAALGVIVDVQGRAQRQIDLFETTSARAAELQEVISVSATLIGEAQKDVGDQMTALTAQQTDFGQQIDSAVRATSEQLSSLVSDLEKQTSEWLAAYSSAVERQVEHRMGVWDEHSRDYAGKMLTVAQTLEQVIGEIDDRLPRRAAEAGLPAAPVAEPAPAAAVATLQPPVPPRPPLPQGFGRPE